VSAAGHPAPRLVERPEPRPVGGGHRGLVGLGGEEGVGRPQGDQVVERAPHAFGQAGHGGRPQCRRLDRPRADHLEAGLVGQVLEQEAGEAATLLAGLPDLADPQLVCWGELDGPDRWSLTRAPLSAAAHVRELLWDRLRSAVLTSATLW